MAKETLGPTPVHTWQGNGAVRLGEVVVVTGPVGEVEIDQPILPGHNHQQREATYYRYHMRQLKSGGDWRVLSVESVRGDSEQRLYPAPGVQYDVFVAAFEPPLPDDAPVMPGDSVERTMTIRRAR